MIKITCISDTHGQHSRVKTSGGDILIFAGDWQGNDLSHASAFVEWIDKQDYGFKLIVRGNHDGNYQDLQDQCNVRPGVSILHDTGVAVGAFGRSLQIYGTPWTLQYQNWHYGASENVLDRIFDLIPPDTDILVTHIPPYGVLDNTAMWGNLGSRSLDLKIRRGKFPLLKMHIFGHVHEGFGTRIMNSEGKDVLAVNASQMNENYHLRNYPIDVWMDEYKNIQKVEVYKS